MKVNKIIMILFCTALCFSSIGCNKVPKGYLPENEDGMMFDEEGDFVSIYNYCPCVIVDGEDAYVWYCSNKASGEHGDHIAYRRGKIVDGEIYWGQKQILFGPTENTYYSGNICDPDVIKGEFNYKGEVYGWLMTVLGCTTVDNSSNMFGFKVAKTPDGPWIDVPEISPLYDFYDTYPGYKYDGLNNFIWGWGQSSLISVDNKGKVLLFYTGRSTTGQKMECLDFSDLEHPKGVFEASVTNNGIYDLNGKNKDSICNAQFMYDAESDGFYMVCDTHPFAEFEVPTNLPYESRVYYMKNNSNGEFGSALANTSNKWETVMKIDQELTGFFRNHNCCFFRDSYGRKPSGNKLDICYTRCLPGADWRVLYTYRIYHTEYQL